MTEPSSPGPWKLERLRHRVLSVSIFVKVLGIGMIVALVFGSVTILQTRQDMGRFLGRLLEERTRGEARAVANKLERAATTGDLFSVQQELRSVAAHRRDVLYVIVRDETGDVVAHTFSRGVPADLVPQPYARPATRGFRVLASEQGRVFEATYPMVAGHAGFV